MYNVCAFELWIYVHLGKVIKASREIAWLSDKGGAGNKSKRQKTDVEIRELTACLLLYPLYPFRQTVCFHGPKICYERKEIYVRISRRRETKEGNRYEDNLTDKLAYFTSTMRAMTQVCYEGTIYISMMYLHINIHSSLIKSFFTFLVSPLTYVYILLLSVFFVYFQV